MVVPVELYAVRCVPKLALPPTLPSLPVRFLLLHGFLAHSGSLNSLVVNLRRALDQYNDVRMQKNSSLPSPGTSHVLIDYEIISLDARNHGRSPHTATHTQPEMESDFAHCMEKLWAGPRAAASGTRTEGERRGGSTVDPVVIGIGHSMGSGTLQHYLAHRPNQRVHIRDGVLSPAPAGGTDGAEPHIDAVVSIDMPPITFAELSPQLHEELFMILQEIKKVDLRRITDMRSAHDEFLRCGMTDVRVRGLCSTNLTIDRSTSASPQARWRCNVPVLERALAEGSLFFDEGFAECKHENTFPIQQPVLSLLGGDSPIGGQQRFQDTWPRFAARLEQHVVPGATHTVFFDKPKETLTLIMRFLTTLKVLQE